MELVEFKKENCSDKILESLKGKKFMAVSIEVVDGEERYISHLSEGMKKSQVIYACHMMMQDIFEDNIT